MKRNAVLVIGDTHQCSKCKKVLPLTSFHKDKHKARGHTSQCKACRIAKKKEWMQHPKVKVKRAEQSITYRATENGRRVVREYNRIYGNRTRFGGLRTVALENHCYACDECGSKENLCVHHKDGNGRNSNKPNNVITNLQVLCVSCHMKLHRQEVQNEA